MLVKTPLRLVPTKVTAAIMTTAISAAIRPYSIAVTPSSSRMNFVMKFMIASFSVNVNKVKTRVLSKWLDAVALTLKHCNSYQPLSPTNMRQLFVTFDTYLLIDLACRYSFCY